MKTKSLFFLMLMGLTSFAQITVDSDDVISIGDTRYMATDSSPDPSIAPGNSGTNQAWDFSNLNSESIEILEFIDPSETPYTSDFPDANIAFTVFGGYGYLLNSPTGLYLQGFGQDGGTLELNELWAEWPMEYENTFGWEFQLDTIVVNTFIPLPGADLIRYKKDTANISEVDSWGSMSTPMGDYNALRVKNTASSIDSVWYKALPTSSTIYASDYNIFSPENLTINTLDTVFFTNLGIHDATEVDQETYEANEATSNGGFAYNTDTFHVFTEPGTYYYVCTPHVGMGMKGIITVVDDWTLFQTNASTGVSFSWWSDNNTAGMPVVQMELDNEGNVQECMFLTDNIVTASWNCVADACIDPEDGSGEFNSLEECEASCNTTIPTWSCITNACIEQFDGTGAFNSLEDCEAACISSISETKSILHQVFPNPAKESITFSIEGIATLKIYSLIGELLLEQNINEKQSISTNEFSPGIYQYQLQSSKGSSTGKFQIIK